MVQRAHRAWRRQRAEDGPGGVAWQHLGGEENEHTEEPEGDDGEAEASQDVSRHPRLSEFP